MLRRLLLSLLVLTGLCLSGAARAEKRVALIIGINAYSKLTVLNNPVPDARAIAELLRSHGFTVSDHYDIDREQFMYALESFELQAEDAEVALIYYAGHGMGFDGEDLLAPSDMYVDCEKQHAWRSLDLSELTDVIKDVPKQVVLLDACRNDPFPFCKTKGVTGGFRGLSRITGRGKFLMANATLSGFVAADGTPGSHSPFARSLLANLRQMPQVYLHDVLDRVATEVKESTDGKQFPEVTTRGGRPKVCLDGGNQCRSIDVVASVPQTTQPAAEPPPDPKFDPNAYCDQQYDEAVRSSNKKDALQDYIRRCSEHGKVAAATDIIESIADSEDCDQCLGDKTITACRTYLDLHRSGPCAGAAKNIIASLMPKAPEPAPSPPARPVEPAPQIPVAPSRSFTTYSGYDLFGGDYSRLAGKVGYETCISACRNDSRCKAFTYNTKARACFLKSQVPQLSRFTNAISGVLASLNQPGQSSPPQVQTGSCGGGFTTYNNSDFFGNDIGGYSASLGQCRNLCLGNARCRGFSWIRKNVSKRCWLKFALAAPSTNTQVISCARN